MKKEEGEATTTTKDTPATPAADATGPTAGEGEGEGEGEKMEEDTKPATDQGEQGTSSKDDDMDLD